VKTNCCFISDIKKIKQDFYDLEGILIEMSERYVRHCQFYIYNNNNNNNNFAFVVVVLRFKTGKG
jgi:hypothetical protein